MRALMLANLITLLQIANEPAALQSQQMNPQGDSVAHWHVVIEAETGELARILILAISRSQGHNILGGRGAGVGPFGCCCVGLALRSLKKPNTVSINPAPRIPISSASGSLSQANQGAAAVSSAFTLPARSSS